MTPKNPTLVAVTLCCAFLFGSSFSSWAESEAVQLSDTSGRVITAKIILVSGEEVEIEMNGQRFTLPISKFSLSSRELIKKHAGADTPATPDPTPSAFVDTPIFQFTDLDFKEKKTDHFSIRRINSDADSSEKSAEAAE